MYERLGKPRPCATCRNRPEDVDPANSSALQAWPFVQSFWVVGGMGDPVGWDAEKAASYLERLGLYSVDTITRLTVYADAALAGIAQRRKADQKLREAVATANRR